MTLKFMKQLAERWCNLQELINFYQGEGDLNSAVIRVLEKHQEALRVELSKALREFELELNRRVESEQVKTVLRYRYIEGLTVKEIAERMYYSPGSVYKWHKQGLELFNAETD